MADPSCRQSPSSAAPLFWFLPGGAGSRSNGVDTMEQAKMASPKSGPKDAQVMAQILKDMGITEYEPRVINQMLEFTYRYVTTILEDAKIYSSHAKKNNIDADDVRLAIQCRTDQSFTSPPPRDFLLDIARQKNQTPLPLIKPYAGPRLPPDRYCLTAPNYRLKALQKKISSSAGRITVPRLSVGAVTSRPSTPTLGTPSAQTVSVSKVGTPVSLTGQRFTVQIPTSQTVKTAPTSTPTVQNVLINPSLIGSKNILITTNMVSSQNTTTESNSMKRKHEDDEDYDAM
ncbi:transcription initiation factor TFIID subunit 9-like [Spea bombifrons]|uniref:transcription initiation factor TFIID subunit 9-like n=1 Tax=Spea bombifrons TaxID=233779 RepID=UPI00234B14DA|nr:transcription initiation factor TFIID subunit 9-like [Spea bombifrons]